MVKSVKTRISWKISRSGRVVGYKLYWTKGETLNYRSHCADIGNVNEILLPDDLASFELNRGRLKFGLTAVNQDGNESDILTIGSLDLSDPQPNRVARKNPSDQTFADSCEADPVACYSDEAKQRLFMYLNIDPTRADCLDRQFGYEPLRAQGEYISRRTIQETVNALTALNEQLDQVFPD